MSGLAPKPLMVPEANRKNLTWVQRRQRITTATVTAIAAGKGPGSRIGLTFLCGIPGQSSDFHVADDTGAEPVRWPHWLLCVRIRTFG